MEDFKVRDTRNGEWFWVNRLVLEHPYLTKQAKLVYCALASFTSHKKQKAFPSITTLCRLASVRRSTAIDAIKSLEKYKFIKADKKEGKVTQYTLLKLLDEKPKASIKRALDQSKAATAPVQTGDSNKNDITKPIKEIKELDALGLLNELLAEKRRDLQIIGIWVRERRLDMPNKFIRGNIVRRNVRAAGLLKGYEDRDIVETIGVLSGTSYLSKFTLETVGKYIDEVVKSRKQGTEDNPIIRFEKVEKDGKIMMRKIYAKK